MLELDIPGYGTLALEHLVLDVNGTIAEGGELLPAVAPLLIGDGRPGLRFGGSERLADCLRPDCRVYRLGSDQLWDLDLRT